MGALARRIADGRQGCLTDALLLVLMVVETTDLLFATDSIPAVFAVSTDVFIVYTSNVFAILGLRALQIYASSIQLYKKTILLTNYRSRHRIDITKPLSGG